MKTWLSLFSVLVATVSIIAQTNPPRSFLPPYNFRVDSVSLLATWEPPRIILLEERFEADAFPPGGWTSSSLGIGWLKAEYPPDTLCWNTPAHPGGYALVNDDGAYDGNDGSLDFLITPVMDLTVADSFMLSFDSYFDGGYDQQAFLEYSVDNGATWQLLKQLDASLQWEFQKVDLSQFSGSPGQPSFQLAFHADDNGYTASGWAIDNVTVYSEKISDQVLSYEVFLDDAFLKEVNTESYQYAFEYKTLHRCGVLAYYQEGKSDTLWQIVSSFYLAEPEELTGECFFSSVYLNWFPPREGWKKQNTDGFRDLSKDQMPKETKQDTSEVIFHFPAPDPINSCRGICDDGMYLWITDPSVSPVTIYQVSYEGESTGVTLTVNLGQSWLDDMVSDGMYLYICLVGGPNSIAKVDLETGETVTTITGEWATSPQRGLAADFINEEFYIGGSNNNQIWRTTFEGSTISTFSWEDVSGLAWVNYGGPYDEGSLWIVVNSPSEIITEVDPNNDWEIIQTYPFPGGQPYSGAGIETFNFCWYRELIWLCNRIENNIYLIEIQDYTLTGARDVLPDNLLGYNIYKNGRFYKYSNCNDICRCGLYEGVDMGDETYLQLEVSALYDLTKYGMPGDTGESLREGPITLTGCPFNELDFYEDWSTYWFDRWKYPGNDWRIANAYGNEAPSALFRTDSNMMLYDEKLESFNISTDGKINDIFLEYDVSLSSDVPTGAEELNIQVFDFQTKSWNTVKTLTNIEGSYEWRRDTLNISNFFNGDVFKIGFDAKGENSADLDFWAIDNIVVRSECLSPINVQVNLIPSSEDSVLVSWNEPLPDIGEWREWDDGNQANQIGFGIGKCMWAGCAVRWTPEQLISLKGAKLTAISFIPTNEGYYSTQYEIAVWTGDNRDLIRRQAAGNLIRDEWNNITLDEPVPIDITNELLVGYQYSQSGGYSMSADAGPAVEGYGNLVQFGTFWQTLYEINPDLNYNWNIKAWFERDGVPVENYRLYRSIDGGEPVMIAEPEEPEYPDHSGSINEMYCYKLKSVYQDGCESEFSDETCILFTGVGPVASAIKSYVHIFPNPSSDLIRVVSSETIQSIRIYNSFGLLIMKKKVDEKQLEIPVSAYPAGVYMIRVDSGGRVISKKVMVIH